MSDRDGLDGASGRLTGAEMRQISRARSPGLTRAGLPLAQGLSRSAERAACAAGSSDRFVDLATNARTRDAARSRR